MRHHNQTTNSCPPDSSFLNLPFPS